MSDVHSLPQVSSFTEHSEDSMTSHLFRQHVESRQDGPQVSLTLNPKVISKVVEKDLDDRTSFNDSLLSSNNFINYCATVPLPLTNGSQVTTGSCNPAPMGSIPSIQFIPSTKFQSPTNGGVMSGHPFVIQLAVRNVEAQNLRGLDIGNVTNPMTNYQAAPQQLDSGGLIKRRIAIIIESLSAMNQTTPPNPTIYDLFHEVIDSNDVSFLSVNLDNGLKPGVYRISSLTRGLNFQPIVLPVMDHGAMDDAIYITVTADEEPQPRAKRRIVSNSQILPRQTGATTTSGSDSNAQSSTTLLNSQISTAFASDGENKMSGTTASLTSHNNFINYCLTIPVSLTNGQQRRGGGGASCNPIPIGAIPATSAIPAFKFVRPGNFDRLDPGKPFSIMLNYKNMVISMTNPDTRYLSAPQRLDSSGMIRGYARVVIEALTSFNQTDPTDPTTIAYASPMTNQDGTGTLVTNATDGLPAGFYRLSSMAVTENHYPVALPESMHGAINDVIYVRHLPQFCT
ncbi:hypothetical protein V5O48_014421 [Marasmius crinis-equi]|uniref:Uncharacterized protein n=1 Tax=Marasmius crinis-equi TaxID=585013 RepID=A0ABR3EXC4_9AGAR